MPNDNQKNQGAQKFQPKKDQANKPGLDQENQREQQGSRGDVGNIDNDGMKTPSSQPMNADEGVDKDEIEDDELEDEESDDEQVTGRQPSQRDLK